MVKREILRDIESDDKEETQRKKEREKKDYKREKGWQVGSVLFLAARIQVQNPSDPLFHPLSSSACFVGYPARAPRNGEE